MAPYAEAAKKLGPRLLAPLTDLLAAVGQAHLLRRRVATELRNLSRQGRYFTLDVHVRSACMSLRHCPKPLLREWEASGPRFQASLRR